MMCCWKKKYNTAINLIDSKNIAVLKERVRILFIDDEDADIVETLKDRNYNVYYKNDINYTIEAEPFDVIFLDIRGVAKKLHSSMEGFQMAKEIKKQYPMKIVYCFSSTTNVAITQELSQNLIDGFIMKDQDIDKWCEKLDNIIKDYFDRDKIWQSLERELRRQEISQQDIKGIQTAYYNSFKTKNFGKLYEKVMGIAQDATVVTNLLLNMVEIIKLFIV